MKLHLPLLKKFIELPAEDTKTLRNLLDDLGLEVKDVAATPHTVFTIETLANRGDHLYTLGIARELSARLLTQIKLPQVVTELSDRKPSIVVRKETDKCSRYTLLELNLTKALTLRPEISEIVGADKTGIAIVDLLNYIQLELGQPMHAFDKDKVEGEIVVKLTSKEEEIEALDGKSYKIPKDSVVICDRKKIIAVGGVIGCKNSMVSAATTRIFIEAAGFDPILVRKTARKMGLSTEASYAFERGTDIDAIELSLKRLLFLADGAHAVGFASVDAPAQAKKTIALRPQKIKTEINAPRISDTEITSRLKNLGYVINQIEGAKEMSVVIPSWRVWDVANEEDLIEDFARSYSLSKINTKAPQVLPEIPEENEIEALRDRLEPVLHGNGFTEVISKGFYGDDDVKLISGLWKEAETKHVRLKNALEKSYSAMKITNILHLGRLLEANYRRGVFSGKVYEVGRLFNSTKREGALAFERDFLTVATYGSWYEKEWGKIDPLEERLLHFKGAIESLLRTVCGDYTFGESSHPLLHPGYQATISQKGLAVGVFGLIHPQLALALETKQEIFYAEIDCELLSKTTTNVSFSEPSLYPFIKRDITLKVPERYPSQKVLEIVTGLKLDNLISIYPVDQFKRQDEDFRRLTYRLTFQRRDRTLAHDEVDKNIDAIISSLANKSIDLAK